MTSSLEVRVAARDVEVLTAYVPIPPSGMLPVNAFLLRAEQPVLVDTGMRASRDDFVERLASLVDLDELRWVWLSHTDPDHIGSLEQVLARAKRARVVTTFLGMGKLGLLGLPTDRVFLLNPGQSLDVGDRRLLALKPPVFDAPETTGFFDTKTRALFSADCFGALLEHPAEAADDIEPAALREGLVTWATVDAPWLSWVEPTKLERALDEVRKLEPSVVLSGHLPPAKGITASLLAHLAEARLAEPHIGMDQAAFERLLESAAPR